MNIAASIDGRYEWAIADGNREEDPYEKLSSYLITGKYKYIGFTIMPGPQTKQAIPFAKKIKEAFPETIMIWGGYFPTNHYKVVLNSGYVDFVINGPGDHAFPQLIDMPGRRERDHDIAANELRPVQVMPDGRGQQPGAKTPLLKDPICPLEHRDT